MRLLPGVCLPCAPAWMSWSQELLMRELLSTADDSSHSACTHLDLVGVGLIWKPKPKTKSFANQLRPSRCHLWFVCASDALSKTVCITESESRWATQLKPNPNLAQFPGPGPDPNPNPSPSQAALASRAECNSHA